MCWPQHFALWKVKWFTPLNSYHLSRDVLSSSDSWHLYLFLPVNQSQFQYLCAFPLVLYSLQWQWGSERQTSGDEFLCSNSLLRVISQTHCHWCPASPDTQSLCEWGHIINRKWPILHFNVFTSTPLLLLYKGTVQPKTQWTLILSRLNLSFLEFWSYQVKRATFKVLT